MPEWRSAVIEPSPPSLLWRMRGPTRIVAARLYPRKTEVELRVFFEPEQEHDILGTDVRGDAASLLARAERLRAGLLAQGWIDVTPVPGLAAPTPANAPKARKLGRLAVWFGLFSVTAWAWRRNSRESARKQELPESGDQQ